MDDTSDPRIPWVTESCRLLEATARDLERTRPFAGLTLGASIHLEPKTAKLLDALRRGGATVVCTGNLGSTQPATATWLRERGVDVVGAPTRNPREHDEYLDEVAQRDPNLLLDNGGDLFTRWIDDPWPELLGGTEETTSGRMRLAPLRDRIRKPLLVINDSPIKQFAENRHAVGQSVFESFLRFTNRATQGRRVTVFGYGACGQGIAAAFRRAFSVVTVVDVDPVKALEAHLDGFLTPSREDAIRTADILITVTGARHVLTVKDLELLTDDAILANAGHFPVEIDVDGIERSSAVERVQDRPGDISTWHLTGGRAIHLLGRGHMVNLAGPRPLGNSIESMDLGFTLQARCLEAIATGTASDDQCVVPVPTEIDEAVAQAYLELSRA